MKCQHAQKGYVLIEALLSIIILSISLVVIIQAMTQSMRVSRYAAEYTEALMVLENKMTEVLKKVRFHEEIHVFEQAQDQEKYAYTVDKSFPDNEQKDLEEIEMQIAWQTGRRRNQMTVATYVWQGEAGEE